jgi:uncharacterized membrane protein YoaK (UPF0700 family)
MRSALVILLTLVTGASDAIAFLKLGNVFASVMTGNMILLGIAAGRGTASLAVRASVALAGYVAGALIGGRIAGAPRSDDPPWPSRLSFALGTELVLLGAFAVLWEVHDGVTHGAAQSVLLALSAAALGTQSAAILRLGIPGLSTTYLTGTLTTLVHAVAQHGGWRQHRMHAALLIALIAGATAGGALAVTHARFAPLTQLVPILLVIVLGVSSSRREPRV